MIYICNLEFAPLFVFALLAIQTTAIDSIWYTTTLKNADNASSSSNKAVDVAPFWDDNFLIAGEKTKTYGTSPFLCKATLLGEILWERTVTTVEGNVYSLTVDKKEDKAYMVVSSYPSQSTSFSRGFLVAINNLSSESLDSIGENIHFSAASQEGNTKLFGSSIDRQTGDIFVTGGSTGSLYGPTQGRSDVIAVRISSSGSVLAKVQFGTPNDEFGRAIEVSSDSATVAIAVHRKLDSGGSEAVLYQLDAETLEIESGPKTLLSYGTTPLFTASDVTIYGPTSFEPSIMTIAVVGAALTVPDKKTDVFLHLYTMLQRTESRVPVYIDGAENEKRDDFAVSASTARDGNICVLGYSRGYSRSLRYSLNIFVIAPTGRILHGSESESAGNTNAQVIPSGMTVTEREGQNMVVFVGHSHLADGTKAMVGTILLPPDIQPFTGFGEVAEEAGVEPALEPEPDNKGRNSSLIAPIVSGALIAGLAALIGISVIAYLRIRRNGNNGRTNRGTDSMRHRRPSDSDSTAEGVYVECAGVLRNSALV